ncbi:ATP-binding cassette domain-containing protein [Paenibacillus rhizoplanae]
MHLISGIMSADSGRIAVDGQPLHELSEAKRDALRASAIGYVLQDFHLIPSLTARQNVEIAMTVQLPQKGETAHSGRLAGAGGPGGPRKTSALPALTRAAAARCHCEGHGE